MQKVVYVFQILDCIVKSYTSYTIGIYKSVFVFRIFLGITLESYFPKDPVRIDF